MHSQEQQQRAVVNLGTNKGCSALTSPGGSSKYGLTALNNGAKKALTPYLCYVRDMRPRIQANNPGKPQKDLMIIIGQMWQNLPQEHKQRYYDIHEAEKSKL